MRRALVLATVAAVLLTVGCSGDEPPSSPSGSTSPTTSTTTEPSGDPTDDPTDDPTSDPTGTLSQEDVAMGYIKNQVAINDSDEDAKRVRRCFTRTPDGPACGPQVDGLQISAEALVINLTRVEHSPAAVADLLARTIAAAERASDEAAAYFAACPEGGATSETCVDDLDTFITDVAEPLIEVMAEWEPLLR